ncbi:MAG TPA: DMT family transporter [Rhizobiaceae bacterium]|nr:DMT family transporter [Rhizobiaceae bacterium]
MTVITAPDTTDRVLAGILLTSIAYFLFSTQDAAIKLLVAGISVWQIMLFRSLVILGSCLAIGGPQLFVDSARSPIVKPMLLRSFIILAAWLCYYTAAKDLQLAELTTIYFAAPVIVTVLSIPLLGEKVPLIRWIAVLTGFLGVYIACDPTNLGFSTPILLVLAAATLWATSVVLLRKTALQERTIIQLVLNNGFFLIVSIIPLTMLWTTPSLFELALLVSVGALGGLAQYALFEGMKRAPVSVIAPFEYTSLIWAFGLGYAIWGDFPRDAVFYGAAFIIGAGLIILASERFKRRTA